MALAEHQEQGGSEGRVEDGEAVGGGAVAAGAHGGGGSSPAQVSDRVSPGVGGSSHGDQEQHSFDAAVARPGSAGASEGLECGGVGGTGEGGARSGGAG